MDINLGVVWRILDSKLILLRSVQLIAIFTNPQPPNFMSTIPGLLLKLLFLISSCLFTQFVSNPYMFLIFPYYVWYSYHLVKCIFCLLLYVNCSTNGTYLNWSKLTKGLPHRLCHGDILSFAAPPHDGILCFYDFTQNSINCLFD